MRPSSPTTYASTASQTSPDELRVNGSSLRADVPEFCPAASPPQPTGDTFFDAREWYAPVAAHQPAQFFDAREWYAPVAAPLPVQSTHDAQLPAQIKSDEATRPSAAGAPVRPAPSTERASFVDRTSRWIHGKARAAAICFVAAIATIASKCEQLKEQFRDVFGGAGAEEQEHLMPPPMKGPPMRVHLKPDAVPSACLVPVSYTHLRAHET